MIFVTVGAQMPFDRLVRAVDEWAARRGRDDVFAQIGATGYRPTHLRWVAFLEPAEFRQRYEAAKVIVAHAGTGTLITALHLGKPILVMPRRASLRETRNDHQVATAQQFRRYASVTMAGDERELARELDGMDRLAGLRAVGSHASKQLLRAIRQFIDGEEGALLPAGDEDTVTEQAD